MESAKFRDHAVFVSTFPTPLAEKWGFFASLRPRKPDFRAGGLEITWKFQPSQSNTRRCVEYYPMYHHSVIFCGIRKWFWILTIPLLL